MCSADQCSGQYGGVLQRTVSIAVCRLRRSLSEGLPATGRRPALEHEQLRGPANTKRFDFSKKPPEFLGYNSNLDSVSWGVGSPTNQSRVTVGLGGVHPLRVDEFPTVGPTTPPWTNILVQSYSDWGVVASLHDKSNSNQLTMTAANGSPFVWFERTAGSAAFEVWVCGAAQLGEGQGNVTMINNSGQVMMSGSKVSSRDNTIPLE